MTRTPVDESAFKTLGVGRRATAQDIKRAFRKLAKKYHPDKNNQNPQFSERFKDLSWAYKTALEIQCQRAKKASSGGAFSLGALFRPRAEKCFYPIPARGLSLEAGVSLTFEEAIGGSSVRLAMERMARCQQCGGAGSEKPDDYFCCPKCQGAGHVLEGDGGYLGQIVCYKCLGNGQVLKKCGACGGEGRTTEQATFDLAIAPGVEDSSVIVIRGEGHAGAMGGQAGDLMVNIRVSPSEIFTRKGPDLYMEAKAPFTMAVFGGKIVVPTILGDVLVTIPPGLKGGALLRLKGRGVNGHGSQLVRMIWDVPTNLTAKEEKILAAFARLHGYPVPQKDWGEVLQGLGRFIWRS